MENDSNLRETKKKLRRFLYKLLEPNFDVKNTHHLHLLSMSWNGKTGNDEITSQHKHQFDQIFYEWIICACNLWHKKENAPSTPVLSFALKIGSQLSKNKIFFTKMKREHVYNKLAEVTKSHQDQNIEVSVGFITLLSSVLDHSSGVQWLMTTTYWNDVVDMSLKCHTKYIKQKAYQFVIKLLETTLLLDHDICEEIVELLVEPLNIAAVRAQFTEHSEDKNRNMYQSLKPTLDLVSEVADNLLKKFNKSVLYIFLEAELPAAIQNILNFSQIEDFSLDLLKIQFVFLFHQLCDKLEGIRHQQATHDADTLTDVRVMFDLIQAQIEKDHVRCVIRICFYAHVLYCSLKTHVPLCIRKGETIEFQNQMMLFQLVPVITLGQQFIGKYKSRQLTLTDDFRRDFYLKLAKISAIKTLELTFRWEQRLSNKFDLIEDAIISLQYIQKSKTIMAKEQAALVFQPLLYSLKDAICHLENHRDIKMSARGLEYFDVIIDTIIGLVTSFDLNWKDSIEIITVLDLACDIVQYEYADYQVTVKFLQLLDMAISRCMSPNMVLLMINTNDSAISKVGGLLYAKCQNDSYQIRTYALKVVLTLALDAKTKFTEFIDILLNAELPQLLEKMTINDKEPEVRATAIKCLQALILIEDVWEIYQHEDSFFNTILDILISEPKATVRKEAATIISDIYKHYNFPENILTKVYDVMTHAVVVEIDWEVKYSAIHFWGASIGKNLEDIGMTDRTFPDYIFSKEKKRIVKLTDEELRKRIIKALNNMSNMGTFYIFKVTLQDLELSNRIGKRIATNMFRVFTLIKATPDDKDLDQSLPSNDINSIQDSSISQASSDSQTSPNEDFDLESAESQCPTSPFFSDLLNDLDSYMAELDNISPSISDYSASPSVTQYSDILSPNNIENNDLGDHERNLTNEELGNIDFFGIACNDDEVVNLKSNAELNPANNKKNSISLDVTETEELFNNMVKLNDANFLEHKAYKSGCQVTNPKITSRQYVSPSEYAKLCFEINESNRKKSMENLDEFGSVLNEILEKYDLEMNS